MKIIIFHLFILQSCGCKLSPLTAREIFIFTPLNENKSCIYRKKLEYPLCTCIAKEIKEQ